MKPRLVGLILMVMMLAAMGCTHNLTTLDTKQVYSRTSEANTAKLDAEGNLAASYHGIGATQLMQDPKGNWTNMPGPVGVLSVPMPNGGVGYIISPKDTKIAKLTYTPEPANGAPQIVVEGLEANISTPMGQQVEAIQAALPVLQAMTKEEALATVEKWRIAGDMLPTVADLLKSIIGSFWPASAATP